MNKWILEEHRMTERNFKWNGFYLKGNQWYGFDWDYNPIVLTRNIKNGKVRMFMLNKSENQWDDKWISIDNRCIPLYITQQLYVLNYFKQQKV